MITNKFIKQVSIVEDVHLTADSMAYGIKSI